jgi:hypothetical protein
MAWYDLEENTETRKEYLVRVKYREIITKKARSFKDIINCKLSPGVIYKIVTTMSFNAITVLEYILNNHKVHELYIAVYRMNNQSVNYLSNIVKNTGIKGGIIVSDFFRENKKYEKWAHDLVLLNSDNIRISFAHNHAKVFIARTDDMHIVFEGSGNLSDNARVEQYTIENNKASYEFHKEWITNILTDENNRED